MKILLISPIKSVEEKNHTFKVSSLPLDIIKGLTPPEHQVKIVEEEFEDIDLDEDCDLVGITCLTSTAYRAYYLSEEFRKRKRKVVLGGIHPSVLPEEAIQYADTVVIGEAEGVWEQLIQDCMQGELQKYYRYQSPSL